MTNNFTPAELTALRNDEARCIRILAACRRFAVRLSGAAGNYATFAQHEEVLLDSFAQVVAAHQSHDGCYDQLFAQRYQRAGLTSTDMRRLQQRLSDLQQASTSDEEESYLHRNQPHEEKDDKNT